MFLTILRITGLDIMYNCVKKRAKKTLTVQWMSHNVVLIRSDIVFAALSLVVAC